MKEELITFETAKLAYEKGYTREVVGISFSSTRRNYYNTKGELNGDCIDFIKDVIKYGREKAKVKHIIYPATSQSLLQKWLREKHKEHIKVVYMNETNTYSSSLTMRSMGWSNFKTYEEALEKGLQEALKLI